MTRIGGGNQPFMICDRNHVHRTSLVRLGASIGVTAVLAVVGVACGSDEASTPASAPAGDPAAASIVNGEQLSRSKGCAGCHGSNFEGGAGPSWVGLAGSEVVLADGSTLVADEAYLTRSIADPSADLLDGYSLRMPANNLSDAEIADVVAFITSLSSDG